MENQSMLDKAAKLFKAYSQKNVLYFTADGQAFWDDGLAKGHASSLKDKTVESVTRQEIEGANKVVSLPLKSHDELAAAYLEKFGVSAPDSATDDEISVAVSLGDAIEDPAAKAKAEQEQADADAKAKAEQEQADAGAKAKADQDQADADAKAKADQDQADADAKAKADQDQADADAKAKAEQDQADADAKAKADQDQADADAKAIDDAKAEADKAAKVLADAQAKAEADKAAKAK